MLHTKKRNVNISLFRICLITYSDNGAHALARLRRSLHMVANNPNKVNPPMITAKTIPAPAARLFKKR